jgi:hypothetical protein
MEILSKSVSVISIESSETDSKSIFIRQYFLIDSEKEVKLSLPRLYEY